ncbi:DUF397 domain-containing protein [Streptomyces lunaelactis]|uniref:DUF397 domain-containing protein n=1 Tax=Streptomyces lunaelactis TaxID=1535768 RepID=UPI0015853D11|nr:DUF397 domain-containing protein [Streptomyces lunaelactis]NUK07229.1 DUF397 domain-containing protein [Streptomyces lunaelactis]NUK34951.1 DUF397 domain-containing protein [Streptomyces lunaelactis]NUK41663.1 DUF397 domain-containing protein [Streptomyces lunaelactis]NUK57894.1 DUF397 domain-containing protein [Streptomyces lunaelactis]NUK92027.1 DUF397 domain-containing protein [Streptomyces lunaelactis]
MSDTMRWFKSSYSNDSGGACIEVAQTSTRTYVRDSKNPDGPLIALAPDAWGAFLASPALA